MVDSKDIKKCWLPPSLEQLIPISCSSLVSTSPCAGSFESSPLAQLISLLAHPVVKRSSVLTDRLLRLLALVSMAIPDQEKNKPPPAAAAAAAPTPAAASTSNNTALDLDGALLGRATEVPSCSRQEQQQQPQQQPPSQPQPQPHHPPTVAEGGCT